MQNIEISTDALIVSTWKEHFQAEERQRQRVANVCKLKEGCNRPIEYAVCNDILVGDWGQIRHDIERGSITKDRVDHFLLKALSLGLTHRTSL